MHGRKIRCIKVVFAGNTHQREQGIAPGIRQSSAHLVRCRRLADWADRPVGRYPFPGRVREHGRQPNQSSLVVDRGGLHGRNLVFAQCLAHDLEPGGERGITERPIGLPRERRADGRRERFLWIDQFALRLGECSRNGADRFTGALHGRLPSSAHQSSPPRTWSVSPGFRARWLPWRPPA